MKHFIQTFGFFLLTPLSLIAWQFNVNGNSHLAECQKDDIPCLASKIKLIVLDVDGVLTDGSFTYDQNGNTQVSFHVHDFVGILIGMRAGIQFAIITAGENSTTAALVKKLKIDHYYTKRINKFSALEEILKATGYNFDEVAFIGDDYVDETCMRSVGLPMSVPNAMDEIKTIAKWLSRKSGGEGAAREAIQFILESQGKWENIFK